MARDGLIGETFVELADTLVEGYDVIEFLQNLAARCVELLGVAESGIVLADDRGDLQLLASSSERMRLIELVELQRHDGPCQQCWQERRAVRCDDLGSATDRWPRFVPAALEAGFRSAYAVPMRLREEQIGALNLFANRVSGLAEDDQALGQAMADVATIGILQERFARERDALTEQLQVALNSRVVLEQAKGIISQQAGLDVDAAFALLRGYARAHNRRLGDAAAAVINHELSATDLTGAAAVPPSGADR